MMRQDYTWVEVLIFKIFYSFFSILSFVQEAARESSLNVVVIFHIVLTRQEVAKLNVQALEIPSVQVQDQQTLIVLALEFIQIL